MKACPISYLAATIALIISGVEATSGQVVTGVPGSPTATTTVDGKQLPAPPAKFGGVIKESAKDSTPCWPPRIVPPKGAPNVLLIMTDDQGYGVSGTFGGVIPTPALDRIAKAGLRYTQFHSTALCSPTRAALITGRNHHSVGFGVIGGIVHGLSRATTRSSAPRTPPSATILKRQRLRDIVVRQEPQHARLSIQRRRALRSMAGRAWASSTSTASWAARPTSGRRTCSATTPRSFRGSASPATTSPPTWRTTPSSTCGT